MFDYTLKNSRRAKNIRISINSQGKVILTKPWLVPKWAAEKFLLSKKNWIEQALQKIPRIKTDNKIWFHGQTYELIFKIGRQQIIWNFPRLNIQAYNLEAGKRALVKFFKTEASREIKISAQKFSRQMDLNYRRILLKDQSSRWGSCSSQKNLNFNWRLIMAPPEVLDYVVIHELAHLRHMDHSMKFWDLVEKFSPNFRDHKRWLRKHQQLLQNVLR